MQFFSVALALGLALTATASPAGGSSSGPVVQAVEPRADAGCTCDDAHPGDYQMPYPNWGKWKPMYDADVKKYGHNKYGGHHHKDSCSSGKGHGSMGHGSSDGHSSGHGGGMAGGHGNHHNSTEPGDDGGNGDVDVPTNNQDIACSAGAPFCCFADNGSQGGQICSNNVTACDSTVICCNNNGGFQICIGDLDVNGPLTINIFV